MESLNNIFGNKIIELDTVGSTNNYAADLRSKTIVQNGTVILAHEQTNGRGQRDRKWHSSAGKDLTFSIILYPGSLSAEKQFYLSRAISLGIVDHLRSLISASVRIKWPNDIFVDDKKIGGILIENEIQGEDIVASVVGIGLNVGYADSQVDFIHTSLDHGAAKKTDLKKLLKGLLLCLERRYNELRTGKFHRLAHDHSNALYLKGRWTEFSLRGKVIRARILDVEDDGRLIIETDSGDVISEGHALLRHILYGIDISG